VSAPWRGRRPFTPFAGRIQATPASFWTTCASVRLPAFYELDLRCDRRFLYEKFTLDVYVELANANATATRRVVGLVQDSTSAPLRQDGFTIVLPSIGVHADF
jgi:hypothetical protein